MMVDAPARSSVPRLTVVTPAYNEERNLPVLHEHLRAALDGSGAEWEWLIVDDSSIDRTFAVAGECAAADRRVRAYRLSRNFGSHTAVMCGLDQARGDCAVVLAADMQDPPEVILSLLAEWRGGAQVVWAVRARRLGESRSTILFSRFYRWMMRKIVGLRNMPAMGADFVLLDRRVIDAVCSFRERNASFFALVTWMGFRQASIQYDKQARLHGESNWTLRKKIKLVVDSLTSFSYLPIRLMSVTGFVVAFLGALYSVFVFFNALFGAPALGWSSLMAVLMFLGGMQMCMLGILGEYTWRGLDEARVRPRYLIEDMVDGSGEKPPAKEPQPDP
jgi:polyisoprenyl-phosphate glycosyltransferase